MPTGPPPTQTDPMEKQPEARFNPPVDEKVEVAVEKLRPLVVPTERREDGEVVPIPTLPLTVAK